MGARLRCVAGKKCGGETVKIIERFHLLFVSDVRTVYENFVYFIFLVVFAFLLAVESPDHSLW